MDHIGFRAPDLNAFTANVDKSPTNIHLGRFRAEGTARIGLLKKCPHGTVRLVDPDGTPLITP
jgi:hypothetical protein